MRYEVVEWAFLTNQMAQALHHEGGLDLLSNDSRLGMPAPWTLKGTEYLWLRQAIKRFAVRSVLDIGPQSSPIPQVLAEDFDVDAWAIDKFGDERSYAKDRFGELADRQGGDPREIYGSVNYVNAFMGESNPDLMRERFDLIYSLSTLEHIDYDFMPKVFDDIDRVLKPGGYMAHAVDLSLPLGVSAVLADKLDSQSERVKQIQKLPFSRAINYLLAASSDGRLPALPMVMGQWLYHFWMSSVARPRKPYLMTASGWARFLKQRSTLEEKRKIRKTGSLHGMLSQDVYRETVGIRYELWPPEKEIKHYWPMTTLMFILRKSK